MAKNHREDVVASACPHCGGSIALLRPVGRLTLDAALAVLRGKTTAPLVADYLLCSVTQATDRLRRAQAAGLIKMLRRETRDPQRGGAVYRYVTTSRLRAFAPDEFTRQQRAG